MKELKSQADEGLARGVENCGACFWSQQRLGNGLAVAGTDSYARSTGRSFVETLIHMGLVQLSWLLGRHWKCWSGT